MYRYVVKTFGGWGLIFLKINICMLVCLDYVIYLLKSLSYQVLVMGGIGTHKLLFFEQTLRPSCLGGRQEDRF